MPPRRTIPVEMPDDAASERIISMQDAARQLGISPQTLRRNYKEFVVQVSPRRQGMRVKDVMAIGKPKAS